MIEKEYISNLFKLYGEEIGLVIIVLVMTTILGIVLGLTKKVIFYDDYNDLGLSAATLCFPTLILLLVPFTQYETMILAVAGITFLLLFLKMILKTYVTNNRSIVIASLIVTGKLVLSFLYVIEIENSFNNKNSADRRKSRFLLVLLTPLLISLVNKKEGNFRLMSNGRLKFQ